MALLAQTGGQSVSITDAFARFLSDERHFSPYTARCYGADLHSTPHLDRLAREGMRFTQAYAMPVCSPTRAGLLTGRHPARLHYTTWREAAVERSERVAQGNWRLIPPPTVADLPAGETTIATRLHRAGYLTFHVGKWHLGDANHSPETHGFDVNIGGTHWGAPESYYWPFRGTNRFREFRYVPGLGPGQPGQHLTDRLTDEAIKLIDFAGDRPFFLNLWFHNPHTPVEPTRRIGWMRPSHWFQSPTTLTRLLNMGVAPFNIANRLRGAEAAAVARGG